MNRLLDIQLDQEELYPDKMVLWEIIKLEICTSTIQYSVNKSKVNKNMLHVEVLKRKLLFWEQERQESGFFKFQEDHINRLKNDIQEINAKRTQGAILRCKAN